MKKELLIAAFFACGAAVAGEFTSEITGILKCSSTNKETIVSIPWAGYGDSAKIKVNEIIRTTGLEAGDRLFAPNGEGGYDSWTLAEGKWVADEKTTINDSGSVTQPGADASKELKRGDGFWLVKNADYTEGTLFDYYLLGQKPVEDGVDVSLDGTTGGKWYLVAPTATEDVNILSKISDAGLADLITLEDGTQYKNNRTGWKKVTNGLASGDIITKIALAPGHGFWYTSHSTATKLSL